MGYNGPELWGSSKNTLGINYADGKVLDSLQFLDH